MSGGSSMDGGSGGAASLNQHYLQALRKYEDIKDEYDALRNRHEDLLTTHNSVLNSLELTQEELNRTNKQLDAVEQDRKSVTTERNGLKQQCTAAIRQWDMALRERNEYRDALAKLQQQHEETVKELSQAMNVRMKASKDLKRLSEERNAAMQESALIMSERDTVLREMEKLSDDLSQTISKIEILETQNKEMIEEKKALSYQTETLKREIQSALNDRDKALKECNDLREKFGDYTKDESIQNFKLRMDFNPFGRERDNARKDQIEDLPNNYDEMRVDNLDQANQEIDKLRKQIDKLQSELTEASQEAEVSKRRRDWAFSERDKIVLERESIRSLCDSLRKERDRAVSDLVVAIRDSDDIKKQRNEASKELKEMKERMETQEKENRCMHGGGYGNNSGAHNHSHDSAIDADMHEWDVEVMNISLAALSENMPLGIELVGARDDGQIMDGGVFVSAVSKNSVFDGKLRVNDCITRVNNLDCCNLTKRALLDTIRNSGPSVSLLVKRRRARCLYTTQLQWHRNFDHGISLESGVYISKISPGSLAAKEGNLAVGDRVLSINNKSIDGVKNVREAINILEDSGEFITITTLKGMMGQNGSIEDERGFSWAKPKTEHEHRYQKMVNSSSQTESRSFSPLPNSVFSINRPCATNTYSTTKPKQTIKEKFSSNSGTWDMIREKIHISRTPKTLKREKHRDSSPNEEYKQEQVDAIAELDSVLNIYHSKPKRKEKSVDQNGGTWPKVRAGPMIHQGTGTVHHPRKTKVRQPLSVVLSHTGNSYQPEVRTRTNRPPHDTQRPVSDFGTLMSFASKPAQLLNSRNSFSPKSLKEPSIEFDQAPSDGSLDFSMRSGRADKEVLDLYVKRQAGKYDSDSGTESHGRHRQLYVSAAPGLRSLPHYPYPPHPHPHPGLSARYPSPSHSGDSLSTYCFEPSYGPSPQPFHMHSPSVELHYSKSRSMPQGHSHPMHRDEGMSSFDGGTFPRKRENARIRIPSNPSVTSSNKVSTGSIERGSERGSPMPTCYVEVVSPDRETKRNTLPDYWIHKPAPGELRKVHIEKFVEPLGIQISCPKGGGVFVSKVNDNSLARQVGLQLGDQLLEVCGINLRNATYALAANVLQQCRDSISMLVQYSPDKYNETEGSNSSNEEDRSRSGSPTPCNSPCAPRKADFSSSSASNSGTVRSVAGKSNRSQLSHTVSTLPRQNPMSRISIDGSEPVDEPRFLFIETKKCSDLGISLVGGNAVGIFVHRVQVESVAHAAGLRTGDQIIEYCGADLRQATAEEAAYELAKPADKVSIIALYNLERYNDIKDKPGDSFYIRALFDRSVDANETLQLRFPPEQELRFHKDDILYVDNTMLNGVPGYWWAWLVDENGQKTQCGVIPSKYKVEEELLRRSMGDLEDARRSSSSARRSFFKRKKHQRNSSRDSKELATFSTVNLGWFSDSGTLHEETSLTSYQRVERLNYSIFRPVILIGPLSDLVTDRLLQDFPDKFTRCPLQLLHCPQTALEKGMSELVIDCRKKGNGNLFECTTINAVRDICDKNSHCILDISLTSIERLHKHQIYPIVLLIKFKSTKQIKEVKDTRYQMDKLSAKAAKEMYEHALKQESEHRHLISAIIQATGVNITYMCTQIKSAIDQEQGKTLWVPSS